MLEEFGLKPILVNCFALLKALVAFLIAILEKRWHKVEWEGIQVGVV